MLKDFVYLIENIPIILSLFIPGAVYVYSFNFMRGQKVKETKQLMVKYVIISYLLNCLIAYLDEFLINPLSDSKIKFFTIVLGSISGIIFGKISECNFLNELALKFADRSIYDNFLCNYLDYEKGQTLRLESKDRKIVYEGVYNTYEKCENMEDMHITLSYYVKYQLVKNVDEKLDYEIFEDNTKDEDRIIVLRVKDYNVIEILYEKETEVVEGTEEVEENLSVIGEHGIEQ